MVKGSPHFGASSVHRSRQTRHTYVFTSSPELGQIKLRSASHGQSVKAWAARLQIDYHGLKPGTALNAVRTLSKALWPMPSRMGYSTGTWPFGILRVRIATTVNGWLCMVAAPEAPTVSSRRRLGERFAALVEAAA